MRNDSGFLEDAIDFVIDVSQEYPKTSIVIGIILITIFFVSSK